MYCTIIIQSIFFSMMISQMYHHEYSSPSPDHPAWSDVNQTTVTSLRVCAQGMKTPLYTTITIQLKLIREVCPHFDACIRIKMHVI